MVSAIKKDYKNAPIEERYKIAFSYIEKLNFKPASITKKDVDALRDAGFSDREIHDICTITSYFNFVNRIADGLGIELEERFFENESTAFSDK